MYKNTESTLFAPCGSCLEIDRPTIPKAQADIINL